MATTSEIQLKMLTLEEEDQLVSLRLNLEDRQPLRRVLKKYQTHVNRPHPDSREHFLLELESFRLGYERNNVIINAEERQVLEYQERKTQLEHNVLQVLDEIEQLKVTLLESQELRRRKIAYDEITDKINTLPSRAEQESQINGLLAEIASITEEHEADRRVKEERLRQLTELNRVLDQLRIVGKGAGAVIQDSDMLVTDNENPDIEMVASQPIVDAEGEIEEGEELEGSQNATSTPPSQATSSALNPLAAEFQPRARASSLRSRVLRGGGGSGSFYDSSTPGPGTPTAGSPAPLPMEPKDEDIEMGNARPNVTAKAPVAAQVDTADELEEGEASETSSLTPPPDD